MSNNQSRPEHARLSASAAHRWMLCPGSIVAGEAAAEKIKGDGGDPSGSSAFARYGTLAHLIAEKCLTAAPSSSPLKPSDLLGASFEGCHCDDQMVDQEMVDGVQEYIDYVNVFRSEKGTIYSEIEAKLDLTDWIPDGFGTCDALVVNNSVLHVIDLKFGKGVQVYANGNKQLMLYALGAINIVNEFCSIDRVMLHIVQPRIDHIDSHIMPIGELLAFGNAVQTAAEAALSDNPGRSPGESQCQWCMAKATCPALLKLTEDVVMSQFDNEADTLSDDQIKIALDNKKLICAWLDAVETEVKRRLLEGEGFEGYKLVAGRSMRSWSDPETAERVLLRDFIDEDKLYIKKMVSPAQAEKIVGKKRLPELAELISKSSGAPTLAKASDKRPSVSITATEFD